MITITSAQELTETLGGEWDDDKESGLACCPAHDDTNPSLVIAEGHYVEVTLHSRAGCEFPQIIAALCGLEIRLNPPLSQTLSEYATGKGLPESFLRRDKQRLHREAADYAIKFLAEEDTRNFRGSQ